MNNDKSLSCDECNLVYDSILLVALRNPVMVDTVLYNSSQKSSVLSWTYHF